jgi:hypothetical protein
MQKRNTGGNRGGKQTGAGAASNKAPRTVGYMLDGIPALAGLLGGHRRSQNCYARVAPLLPKPLSTQVRPGPIDGAVWTLFAANGGAAAKLRQALPNLLSALAESEPGITE